MKTQNKTSRSKSSSRFYIDATGKLIKRKSSLDKILSRLYFPFSVLPPMVNVMLGMLLFVGLCCITGLCNQPKDSYHVEETATLLFLTVIISFILAIGIASGQMMANQRLNLKNAHKSTSQDKNIHPKVKSTENKSNDSKLN